MLQSVRPPKCRKNVGNWNYYLSVQSGHGLSVVCKRGREKKRKKESKAVPQYERVRVSVCTQVSECIRVRARVCFTLVSAQKVSTDTKLTGRSLPCAQETYKPQHRYYIRVSRCHARSFHVFKQVPVYFSEKLHGAFNFNKKSSLTGFYEYNDNHYDIINVVIVVVDDCQQYVPWTSAYIGAGDDIVPVTLCASDNMCRERRHILAPATKHAATPFLFLCFGLAATASGKHVAIWTVLNVEPPRRSP